MKKLLILSILLSVQIYAEIMTYSLPQKGEYHHNEFGDLVCDAAYVDIKGEGCILKAICERWNEEENSCYSKPGKSHWIYPDGPEWECDEGYHLGNNSCFTCLEPFVYSASENRCVMKPENSVWMNGDTFQCEDGFFKNSEDKCERNIKCGFFERYDWDNNRCVSKPKNSHWSNKKLAHWKCDEGYRYNESKNECEKERRKEESKLNNSFFLAHDVSFGYGIGLSKDYTNKSQEITNIETNYSLGAGFGNELIKGRAQLVLGLLYTKLEYDYKERYSYSSGKDNYLIEHEQNNSTALGVGINAGLDFWRFTFDYSKLFLTRLQPKNVDFGTSITKYKFGFNITNWLNVNLTIIRDLIDEAVYLREIDESMLLLGATIRFY